LVGFSKWRPASRAPCFKLWAEAERLGYLEECGESPIGRARILQQAGDIMQHMSREQDSPGDIVVDRDRHRLEERGAAIAIAEACFYLFGAPLYKLSAILTTVGMDREVTAREVREWWAERPITRSADKGAFFGALSGTRIARV
jgi:hypothetical protein